VCPNGYERVWPSSVAVSGRRLWEPNFKTAAEGAKGGFGSEWPLKIGDFRFKGQALAGQKGRWPRYYGEAVKDSPLGLQSFRRIIDHNCAYVDKTKFIHKLVNYPFREYFLVRPRGFLQNSFAGRFKCLV
jgi:hypothetical protein